MLETVRITVPADPKSLVGFLGAEVVFGMAEEETTTVIGRIIGYLPGLENRPRKIELVYASEGVLPSYLSPGWAPVGH